MTTFVGMDTREIRVCFSFAKSTLLLIKHLNYPFVILSYYDFIILFYHALSLLTLTHCAISCHVLGFSNVKYNAINEYLFEIDYAPW